VEKSRNRAPIRGGTVRAILPFAPDISWYWGHVLVLALGARLPLRCARFRSRHPVLVFGLFNEERDLRQEQLGYPEYCLRTHYYLVPFVS